jgi:hypothetical protein
VSACLSSLASEEGKGGRDIRELPEKQLAEVRKGGVLPPVEWLAMVRHHLLTSEQKKANKS